MNSNSYYSLLQFLPAHLQATLRNVPEETAAGINEIRLRSGRPIALIGPTQTIFPNKFGACKTNFADCPSISSKDIEETVHLLCRGSVYAHQDEICQGFISLPEGHRAGICGRGVVKDGQVENIKEITSVNLRIARQIKGCSAQLESKDLLEGLVIAGPPGSGKTTILRDVVRRLAGGETGTYHRVCVADERGEICAVCNGEPCMDIGLADVICGITKSDAVMMAVRTMNPSIVAFDELGSERDADAVIAAAVSGVAFVASAHAQNDAQLRANPILRRLIPHIGTIAMLGDRPGRISKIYRTKENGDALGGNSDPLIGGLCAGDS